MTEAIKNDIKEAAAKLGVKFKNLEFLRTALTHRSYLNEHRKEKMEHNERLEFLGDAVLELIVTENLFHNFNRPEGELTNLRAALVKGETLTKVSKELDIDHYLLLSRGEAKARDRSRNYILANTMEAVIGAIYLDQGYAAAKKFIEKNIIKELPGIIKDRLYRDPKSIFQEKAQEKKRVTPSYKLISESGPDHDKHFKVGAYLESKLVAKGEGKSKQEAQQDAAQQFLKEKKWD